MKVLVTGSAGFIGYHLIQKLLQRGDVVLGIDSLNDYYDPALKNKRNELLEGNTSYTFKQVDICDKDALRAVFDEFKPEMIVHLAAQPGVRYSLINPGAYANSNVLGTINIFEMAKDFGIKRVVFASSSSVYGANKKIPFSEKDVTDAPVSLYAATKKACELIAHSYHDIYKTEMVGLRFFTVYGPWYRPDMALFSFSKNIVRGDSVKLFNNGEMKRDFTYVTDIVDGIIASMDTPNLQFEIFNLGCDDPVELQQVVGLLEKRLGVDAKKEYLPMQKGDVKITYADVSKAKELLGFEPKVHIEEGIELFTKWFKENQDFILGLK